MTPSRVSATSAASIGMRSTPGLRGTTGRAAPANAPPDVGFTVFGGAFTRERFGRARAGGGGWCDRVAAPESSRHSLQGKSLQGVAAEAGRSGRRHLEEGRHRSDPGRPTGVQQASRAGARWNDEGGEYEQLIEYASMDRNNDGIITAAELELPEAQAQRPLGCDFVARRNTRLFHSLGCRGAPFAT